MKQKNVKLIAVMFFIVYSATCAKSQEVNEFTPYFKPLVLIYSNVNTTFSNGDISKSFEINRAYIGFEYFFSKTISSRVNLDVADPGTGKLQMTAFLKNAYLLYRNNGFSVRLGMIGTDQYKVQEKQWGYRYIYKSFQDAYNFGPSADLGVGFEYSPADFISLDLSVLNGEGYKKLQSDSTFKETFGITLKPAKGFVLRGYFDMMNHNYNQTTFAFFAGYSTGSFKTGIEYNIQKNNSTQGDHDFSGLSYYSSLGFREKYSLFVRYDNLWSKIIAGDLTPWNLYNDGQLFMVGIDYSPVSGVKIAPTFKAWLPANSSEQFSANLALNFEIKF
jgi:hypothetical protein